MYTSAQGIRSWPTPALLSAAVDKPAIASQALCHLNTVEGRNEGGKDFDLGSVLSANAGF